MIALGAQCVKRGCALLILCELVAERVGPVQLFLAWPLAIFVLRDRPAEKGLYPDNDSQPLAVPVATPQSMASMLKTRAFWLLVIGSFCSIGSIGSINQHMKLIFLDAFHRTQGGVPGEQRLLDDMFSTALLWIMLISNGGRLVMGFLADTFSFQAAFAALIIACLGAALAAWFTPANAEEFANRLRRRGIQV